MRLRATPTLRWTVIAAFVMCAAGSATAQPAGSASSSTAPPQVGFERRPQLSPQEQLTQSDAIVTRMEQMGGTVRRQLEAARAARDVVKTLCLNDKLSQIDVAARTARDRQASLQAAVQRSDVELANHEFTIMTVLRQRAEQLSAEANQCIGEEVSFVGQTQVTTSVDPNLPSEDTTLPPVEPVLVSSPPPPLSSSGKGP